MIALGVLREVCDECFAESLGFLSGTSHLEGMGSEPGVLSNELLELSITLLLGEIETAEDQETDVPAEQHDQDQIGHFSPREAGVGLVFLCSHDTSSQSARQDDYIIRNKIKTIRVLFY